MKPNEPLKEGWSDAKADAAVALGSPQWEKAQADRNRAAVFIGSPKVPQPDSPKAEEPLPPRFLDIPVGEGDDRRLASIPFGISVSDYDMIQQMLAMWKDRLTQKQ